MKKKGVMKNEKEKTFGMAHDIGYDGRAHAGDCSGGIERLVETRR